MPEIKCLSIHQPWVELILNREKRVENRSWRTDYTGLLGIHAGKSRDTIRALPAERLAEWLPNWPEENYGLGCLLGVVTLVGCYRYRNLPAELKGHEHAARGRDNWCWVFRNPIRLVEPYPAAAQLGFFYLKVPARHLPKRLFKQLSAAKPSKKA